MDDRWAVVDVRGSDSSWHYKPVCVCVCDYLYDNRSLITRIIDTLVSLFDAHARTHSAGHTQTQRDNERWPQTFPCVILEQCNLLNVLCLLCSPPSHRSVHPACEGLFLYLSLCLTLSIFFLLSLSACPWLVGNFHFDIISEREEAGSRR